MKIDVSAIEQQLWPNGSNRDVYMILDGARDRRIYSDLMNSHLIYSCLYSGDLAFELEVAAPHLVQLEFEDKFTRGLIEKSWGTSWGVLLEIGHTNGTIAPASSNISSCEKLARAKPRIPLLRSENFACLSADVYRR